MAAVQYFLFFATHYSPCFLRLTADRNSLVAAHFTAGNVVMDYRPSPDATFLERNVYGVTTVAVSFLLRRTY